MSAHMIFRYKRKPVAVITLSAIIPGAYDGMAVICDDGAVFASWPDGDNPREWIEGTPVPGTVRDMNVRALAEMAAVAKPVKKKKAAKRRRASK